MMALTPKTILVPIDFSRGSLRALSRQRSTCSMFAPHSTIQS